MKTLHGFEANFCPYCGKNLVVKNFDDFPYAVCPSRFKWFGFKSDRLHAIWRLADEPVYNFDKVTGERLK